MVQFTFYQGVRHVRKDEGYNLGKKAKRGMYILLAKWKAILNLFRFTWYLCSIPALIHCFKAAQFAQGPVQGPPPQSAKL